ncbi:MAG: CotH kinase family protein [Rikenellaceae bacterium]
MKITTSKVLIFTMSLVMAISCRNHDYIEVLNYDNDNDEYDESLIDLATYPDWSEATHSNAVDPNFDVVFAQGVVLRMDITIAASDWSDMISELSYNLSSTSSRAGNIGMMDNDIDFTPMWVPSTINYDGVDWYNVGLRFKGNSSLSSTYSSGNMKLSMKLDFDQYEDDYPALTNQRFYGFKQLNLNNNYNDLSLMREKVGSDLLRQFGLASANTSFCEIYIDYGEGSKYFGLYTIVEEVDDTVIGTQFSDGSGNLYKPEGDAASFSSGSYDKDEFYLKTNTSLGDYSSVLALYNAINSSTRTSDSEAWKSQLESVFNVDIFLKWLAANTTFQNWDTYGNMTHNYYLYQNPSDGLLTWIPWDNNEAFQSGNGALPLSMSSVSSSWPLIRYILDDDDYKSIYKGYLRQFVDDVFVPETMIALYESYYDLLQESAYNENSGRTFIKADSYFDSAVSTLKTHVQTRCDLVDSYLIKK